MVRPLMPLALASVLLAAAPARAEDAGHDLRSKDRWQAGDVRTRTGTATEKRTIHVEDEAGGVLQHQEIDATTKASYVEKVVEVDDAGRPTRTTVVMGAWSRRDAAAPDAPADTSLDGIRLEVTGLGKDRTWKVVSPDRTPTPAAEAWLHQRFGAAGMDPEAADRALFPATPVAVGAGWDGDGPALARAMGDRAPIDAEKAKASGRLLRVEEGKAVVQVEMSLPFVGLPARPGTPPLPWTEGGTLTVSSEIAFPLEGRVRGRSVTSKSSLSGKASAGGPIVTITSVTTDEYVLEPRGDFPEEAPAAPK